MMILLAAIGIAGAVVFGVQGAMQGAGGQLERILALVSLATAAAGIVGHVSRDLDASMRRARRPIGDILTAIVIAPILALCAGVFLLTLIPSIYVMLPFFLFAGASFWSSGEPPHRGSTAHPTPHAPAYA